MSAVDPKKPLVDVVIAARNEADRIGACLRALANQTYPSELIKIYVANNGSTDETAFIALDHGATLVQAPEGHAAAARNAAIRLGSGALVAFLDAHSIPCARWLEVMVSTITDRDVVAVGGALEFLFEDPLTQFIFSTMPLGTKNSFLRHTVYAETGPLPWLPTGNAIFHRSVLERVGLFNEQLEALEDVDLSWKIVLSGFHLSHTEHAPVEHWDDSGPLSLLSKLFRYGMGSARLARAYGMDESGTLGQLSSTPLTRNEGQPEGLVKSAVRLLARCTYIAGVQWYKFIDASKPALNYDASSTRFEEHEMKKFFWSADTVYKLSPDCIFWEQGDDKIALVMTEHHQRIVLSDSSNLVFRCLVYGKTYTETLDLLQETYEERVEILENDMVDFLSELVSVGVLKRECQ